MNALLFAPFLVAAAIWLAGRRDTSRDPRLTTLALGLLALVPFLLLLPKIPLLPAIETTGAVYSSEQSALPWLVMLWLIGATIAFGKLALSAIGLRCWVRRSNRIETIGIVELRELEDLRGPVASGVFRKIIFVPPAWHTWDAATRETVLLHELAHHRRRDPLVRWLAAIATAIHWFNPLVHWMNRRLALQCEHACDRQVLEQGVRRERYAELLCRFASTTRLSVAGLAMADTSSLESRVRHVMAPRQSRGFFTLAALGGLVLWVSLFLPLVGRRAAPSTSGENGTIPDAAEVELRLSANPFPADSP